MVYRIDGKEIALALRGEVKKAVAGLAEEHNLAPVLAVVLVGDDAASHVYVRNKKKACEEAGIGSVQHSLPADVSQEELLGLIDTLNNDPAIHGVLVQFPLPSGLSQAEVVKAIAPAKDVDGLNPLNIGLLAANAPALIPCTPMGVLMLARHASGEIGRKMEGAHAVIIGRSHLVGKPLVQLLLGENCTCTIAHSKTENLPEIAASADILIACVGKPEMVRKNWVKPQAIVLDVGINRIERGGKAVLVGDVAYEEVAPIAAAITPVPGGVGPMTIACLLRNTLIAACRQADIAPPVL
ncbi:MAG: bifunctional 5,10-methylenetetrahydrofolate dehydrogenase/5,10-methenyltetrahydrofolate cyclohydrolase [Parvibaculales bacterium]